jgi:hydrogenase nickel incorporation protein HypA/HybF
MSLAEAGVMHELSIARNIVAIVSDCAEGRKMRRIALEVGKLLGVTTDAIAFCFEAVAQGAALEGAILDIAEVEGRARLHCMRAEFDMPTLYAACACGSRRLHRLRGEDLQIKAIELEVADGRAEPAAPAARQP